MPRTSELVLASASPRRAAILRTLGIAIRVQPADVDESLRGGESGAECAQRLARAKAAALPPDGLPVLAADTLVVLEGAVLGKPRDDAEARAMLERLSGRTHEVVTGVCVRSGERMLSGLETTRVRFASLSAVDLDWYVASGEPRDKAGAYHIDGKGSLLIEAVDGSPTNVAGLPVRLVLRLHREAGCAVGLPPA